VTAEPIFVSDGDAYVPTELARSPWGPDSLHGGAPAALLARAIEGHEVDLPMLLARTTFEFLRPIPCAPLTVGVRTVRPGKKVQLVEATLGADDVEVCRATALRIRTTDVALPAGAADTTPPPPGPASGGGVRANPPDSRWRAFHNEGVEMHWMTGRFEDEGPAVVWIRLPRPLVDDEAPSPTQRVMAAADFGNGVSRELPFGPVGGYLFINPDLTVYLHRPPSGEWICLDAHTHLSEAGTGLAESALSDEHGRLGRSVQALLIDALP
jgi:hypothetical protein